MTGDQWKSFFELPDLGGRTLPTGLEGHDRRRFFWHGYVKKGKTRC